MVTGRVLILSATGAWIEASGTYPVASSLTLRFVVPPVSDPIVCQAIVRNGVEERGVGVEFLDLLPDDVERINAFVEHHG